MVLVNLIASQLDRNGSYVRVLFVEFSSAFNTVQLYGLIKRLLDVYIITTL